MTWTDAGQRRAPSRRTCSPSSRRPSPRSAVPRFDQQAAAPGCVFRMARYAAAAASRSPPACSRTASWKARRASRRRGGAATVAHRPRRGEDAGLSSRDSWMQSRLSDTTFGNRSVRLPAWLVGEYTYSEPSWKRSNSSAAVSHSMIQPPTCARRAGSATRSRAAPRRCAAASPNFCATWWQQQRPLPLDPFLAALFETLFETLFAALFAALLDPLRGPLLNGFGQHRPHLLEPRQRPGHRPAEPTRQQHLRRPFAERRRQLPIILLPKQIDQRPQQRRGALPVPIRLQRDQRRHQVARRKIGAADAPLVQQEVPLRRLIPRQRRPARPETISSATSAGAVHGRRPL